MKNRKSVGYEPVKSPEQKQNDSVAKWYSDFRVNLLLLMEAQWLYGCDPTAAWVQKLRDERSDKLKSQLAEKSVRFVSFEVPFEVDGFTITLEKDNFVEFFNLHLNDVDSACRFISGVKRYREITDENVTLFAFATLLERFLPKFERKGQIDGKYGLLSGTTGT